MSGSQKITDTISKETHEFLSNNFKVYGPIWHPMLKQGMSAVPALVEKIPAAEAALLDDGSKTYGVFLKNVGLLEIGAAAMLLAPGIFSGLATLLLLGLMGAATYTHIVLNEPPIGPVVLILLLVCRAIMPSGSEETKSAKPARKASGRSKKD
eukprot:CAMPEP_0181316234 /NCGR_PEP_ID=MMETSP1101-20121128/15788_1 /TAXON_ID=46948 /ORGANISM="Rhodomonas abbreviata, Strain Caron Lab Isolate" /LENGTH=152 /DNA_ID=CAMNT_0023423471 /DNA_START=93 /DNA_END=551 /DNA_ORIENTATION=+